MDASLKPLWDLGMGLIDRAVRSDAPAGGETAVDLLEKDFKGNASYVFRSVLDVLGSIYGELVQINFGVDTSPSSEIVPTSEKK